MQHRAGKNSKISWEDLGGVHQSWNLDSAGLSDCWDIDHANLPLVDWMMRGNSTPRDRLKDLTDPVHIALGRQYIDSYADTVMAGTAIDYLVKSLSCTILLLNFQIHKYQTRTENIFFKGSMCSTKYFMLAK